MKTARQTIDEAVESMRKAEGLLRDVVEFANLEDIERNALRTTVEDIRMTRQNLEEV